jgi:shikimate dehydrogenase
MPDPYAIVGNPISHSKSPLIHAEFARLTAQDMTYSALLAALDGFAQTVQEFAAQGGKGLNVTVPFKEEAFRISSRVSARARAARAVNTLKREGEEWFGENTDGAGLVRDLKANLQFELKNAHVLLMGAGGAARGVLLPLLQAQPRSLTIVNRTLAKAEQLQSEAKETGEFADLAPLSVTGYERLSGQFDLIINATSASLKDTMPPMSNEVFAHARLVYDLMYGVGITPFLKFAHESGAQQIAEGIGMLVEQAAESFHVWRGIRPPTQELIARLKTF